MNKNSFLVVAVLAIFTLLITLTVLVPLTYAHHPSESICKGGTCECEGNGGPGGDGGGGSSGSGSSIGGGGFGGGFGGGGSGIGGPPGGGNGGNCPGGMCKIGLPNLSVSMTNLNLTINDTPVAYTPALGPEVRFNTTYNSVGNYYLGPLGYYWTHNYNVYLTFGYNYDVTLNRGSGKEDIYYCYDAGVCTAPTGIFDILTKNPDDTYTLETKDHTKYDFSSSGKLEEIVDRYNNALDLVYNDTGLHQLIDAKGRTTTIDHNDTGLIETITLPDGRFSEFEYNGSDLVQVTDEAGQITNYTPDLNHLIRSISTSKTNIDISYQLTDRISQITGDITRTYTWSYVNYVSRTNVTDANGHKTTYPFLNWEENRRRITAVTDHLAHSTLYHYDPNNNADQIKDANGKTTYYTFDSRGNRIYEKDPLGYETFYTYDTRNNLTSVTNPRGKITEYAYGSYDNLLSITEKDPQQNILSQITYGYTDARFPYLKTSMTDANGNTTTYEYDDFGRLIEINAPELSPVTFAYNNFNDRKVSMTNANGTTYYEYDNLDRITKITHPDTTYREYTYDCCGLSSVRDENGKITGYEYDELGRLTKVIDPEHGEEHPTTYEYDGVGNLRFLTDAEGNTTEYQYNEINQLIKIIYPLSDSESYTYDAVGNMLTKEDANGDTTSYAYDANNRLIKITPGRLP